jgi:hypothetical protein
MQSSIDLDTETLRRCLRLGGLETCLERAAAVLPLAKARRADQNFSTPPSSTAMKLLSRPLLAGCDRGRDDHPDPSNGPRRFHRRERAVAIAPHPGH